MKLLFMGDFTAPYMLELFRHMAHEKGADIRATFCTSSYVGRNWEAPPNDRTVHVYPSIQLPWLWPDLILTSGVKRYIQNFKPDVAIVGSYLVPGLHRAMSVLTRMNIPWLFWEEFHRFTKSAVKNAIRRCMLNSALRRCSGVLAIGRRAQDMFTDLVDGRVAVHNFPYASDLSRFANAPPARKEGRVRFLCSNALIERKGVDVALRAFISIAGDYLNTDLVILGEGPLAGSLKALVPPALQPRVQFMGMIPWQDVPKHYSEADVFLLPSRHDGWALVVPEAMAAGLPVISTREVGASLDLVTDHVTGFLFDKDDTVAMAGHMKRFLDGTVDVPAMVLAAREQAMALDVSRAGPRLIDLLEKYT